MTQRDANHLDGGPTDEPSPWNLPNLLCVIRIVVAPGLIVLAAYGLQTAMLSLLVFMMATDWLDGLLARMWNQRTALGARLDTVGDAAMWCGLLIATGWLHAALLVQQSAWLGIALAAWFLAMAAGLWKFGRVPSYHSWAAKFAWVLTAAAVLSIFARGPVWPLWIAMIGVTWANLESFVITLLLPHARRDIPSLFHLLRSNAVPPSQKS